MKRILEIFFTTVVIGSLSSQIAWAEGHYVPGVEGIQAATAPPPGFYYLGYFVDYNINSFRAPGSSSNLPGNNSGTVVAQTNRFTWITNYEVLGGNYGFEFIIPIVRTSLNINAAGISESSSGVSDIYIGPAALAWHGANWDAMTTVGVYLDTGSTSNPASAGKGFKTGMLTFGSTYYFDTAKKISGSAMMRYEVNGNNNYGFRNGNQFTLEWGVDKVFGAVQAGVVGYSQVQTTKDSGPGASSNKSSRHALGVELIYPIRSAGLILKGALYDEIDAKAGTNPIAKGNLLRLSLIKAF